MHNKVSLEKVSDTKGTLKRIWNYLKRYKLQLVLVVLFIILYITFNTISSLLLTPIIDEYITPMISASNIDIYITGLIKQLIYLIFCAILSSLSTYLQYKTMVKIAQCVVKDMRKDLFDKLSVLPLKYYDRNPHGDLMSSITNDLDNVSTALNNSIDQIISAILNLIVTLVVMFSINTPLTVISIVSIPLLFIVSGFIMKMTKKQFARQQ